MCPCQYGAALSSAPRRGLLLFLACCATPIQVERAEPREMEHELDSNILSTGHISELTRTVREVRRILAPSGRSLPQRLRAASRGGSPSTCRRDGRDAAQGEEYLHRLHEEQVSE